MSKIDIIVPFYNDKDDKWRNIMYEYMAEEGSKDRQVTGDERYRDWDCFKYFFRCIEKNCKWVNKVFVVVASESQIPEWLNTKYEKLEVVYHREFIPEELLPTFDPMTIDVYFSKIKGLSDNYVYMNDDYYFINPTTVGMFFVDDYPVYKDTETELVKFGAWWTEGSDGTFYKVLNTGIDFQIKVDGEKAKWYALDHLPVAHKKDFESKIIDKYYDDFINANNTSRFRNKDNFTEHMLLCMYKDTQPYYKFNIYHNSCYVSVTKDTNFEDYGKCDMICLNDTQLLSNEDFEETKAKMVDFFNKRFPDKSLYEI